MINHYECGMCACVSHTTYTPAFGSMNANIWRGGKFSLHLNFDFAVFEIYCKSVPTIEIVVSLNSVGFVRDRYEQDEKHCSSRKSLETGERTREKREREREQKTMKTKENDKFDRDLVASLIRSYNLQLAFFYFSLLSCRQRWLKCLRLLHQNQNNKATTTTKSDYSRSMRIRSPNIFGLSEYV